MHKGKTFLAVVLARGGSKRLPKKNILDFVGKPLIAHTIEAAKKSQYIDTIVVSSDDDKILDIASKLDINILKRPDELATDTASSFDAVEHVIKNTKLHDYIVLLQPTSPLRNNIHIDEAIELVLGKNADGVISVTETEHSPLWCNTLGDDDSMANFLRDELKNTRSQDLETYYRLNGAIYICNRERLLKEKVFIFDDNIYAYKMNRNSSIDIDEPIDFTLAELLFKQD